MRYLVLGCGAKSMGAAIAYGLLREPDAQVFVADKSPGNEQKTIKKLASLPCGTNTRLRVLNPLGNGTDVSAKGLQKDLWMIFKNFDVVISALPSTINPIIVESVLLANERSSKKSGRTHYCDLGGTFRITKLLLNWAIKERAVECGACVVPDCGLQPGLGNIIAVSLLKDFDASIPLESLVIKGGGLPASPKYPGYKELFNLGGLEELYYACPWILKNGKPFRTRPRSRYEKNGSLECVTTAGLGALPFYLQDMVMNLEEKTWRWPGHYEMIKKIPRNKFVEMFGEMLRDHQPELDDFVLLKIEAVGKNTEGKKIRIERQMTVRSDEHWNSMQKPTGFATAHIAKLLAEGKGKPGSAPPEITLDPELVLKQVEKDFIITKVTTPL